MMLQLSVYAGRGKKVGDHGVFGVTQESSPKRVEFDLEIRIVFSENNTNELEILKLFLVIFV